MMEPAAPPAPCSPDQPTDAIFSLLATRGAGATICPSEAARWIAGSGIDWRDVMARVHDSVDELLREGSVTISWKGEPLAARSGPYRIARPQ